MEVNLVQMGVTAPSSLRAGGVVGGLTLTREGVPERLAVTEAEL